MSALARAVWACESGAKALIFGSSSSPADAFTVPASDGGDLHGGFVTARQRTSAAHSGR